LQQEIDHTRIVHFDQRSNHAQTCQTQILKRTSFRRSVQKGIQIQRNVSLMKQFLNFFFSKRREQKERNLQKERSGFGMRGHTLHESKSVANAIGSRSLEFGRRRKKRVDGNDFLQQRRDGAIRIPKQNSLQQETGRRKKKKKKKKKKK
jgi:hypothetical protein